MIRLKLSPRAGLLPLLVAATIATALADTDGYFTTAWGARAKGLAGLSLAFNHDGFMVANNPAGILGLGRRFDVEMSFFSPVRHYSVSGNPTGPGSFVPGTVKSGKDLFLVPEMAALWPLKDGS